MIDTKLDTIIKRKIIHYLGDNDEDLAMFVNEHLKDHKGPGKLVEGLEPVRLDPPTLCPTDRPHRSSTQTR
jgi:RNA-binding protein 25